MSSEILVFGSRGFIGNALTNKLRLDGNYSPVEVYRTGLSYVVEGLGQRVTFRDFPGIHQYIAQTFKPTFAVNAIADTSKSESHQAISGLVEANVLMTSLIARLCADLGIKRLLHFGTYSTSMDGLKVTPQTFYAATKSASYEVLRYFTASDQLEVAILEPYDIYSSDHPHGKVISAIQKALEVGSELKLSYGEQELAPIHASDVIRASISALDISLEEGFGIWSLPGPEVLTLRQITELIAISLGKQENLRGISFSNPYGPNQIMKVSPLRESFTLPMKTLLKDGILIPAI